MNNYTHSRINAGIVSDFPNVSFNKTTQSTDPSPHMQINRINACIHILTNKISKLESDNKHLITRINMLEADNLSLTNDISQLKENDKQIRVDIDNILNQPLGWEPLNAFMEEHNVDKFEAMKMMIKAIIE